MDYLLNIIPAKEAAGFTTDDELYNYDVEFYTDMDGMGHRKSFHWRGRP